MDVVIAIIKLSTSLILLYAAYGFYKKRIK